MNNTVVLGMSGGVDSSVAVHLLQKAGYEVIGVHMRLIPERFMPGSSTAAEDAWQVAQRFKIPFHVLDLRWQFDRQIIQNFINEYASGRTPNPCILCNQQMKFGELVQFADQIGVQYIATGHYAKIEEDDQGRACLKKGDDPTKDQSYFLFHISRQVLPRIRFPLSGYSKEEIRRIAAELGLVVANKPDSQEVCFIPDNDYKSFLRAAMGNKPFKPGAFIDASGQTIGTHQGIECYTIGQRKGLGLALGYPAYVTDMNAERNTVTIGRQEELMHDVLMADDLNFLMELPQDQPITIQAKIRYRAQQEPAILTIQEQQAYVVFAQPQRAITPGQGVCFYDGDTVLGGGKIIKVWSNDHAFH